jgi:hypothetical protein
LLFSILIGSLGLTIDTATHVFVGFIFEYDNDANGAILSMVFMTIGNSLETQF